MNGPAHILVLNPGSTSTRIALFRDDRPVLERELRHRSDGSAKPGWADDVGARLDAVTEAQPRPDSALSSGL